VSDSDCYELRVLRAGAFALPGLAHFRGAHFDEWMDTVVTVFLAQNVDRTVLIDTGFRDAAAYDRAFRAAIGDRAGFDLTVATTPADVLAQAGLGVEDIDVVVPSHFHWDHAENVSAFPRAEVLLGDEAWAAVDEPAQPALIDAGSYPPGLLGDVRDLLAAGRARTVPAGEILPGIHMRRVSGHSVCSQLISIRTRRGTVLLAIDNVGYFEHLEARIPPALIVDLAAWYDTIAAIESEDAIVVPSHDPRVFERFPEGRVA
jgi:glyoxylase-like metal-dependent hydrolase (beta-lactamase superfamily II)